MFKNVMLDIISDVSASGDILCKDAQLEKEEDLKKLRSMLNKDGTQVSEVTDRSTDSLLHELCKQVTIGNVFNSPVVQTVTK